MNVCIKCTDLHYKTIYQIILFAIDIKMHNRHIRHVGILLDYNTILA